MFGEITPCVASQYCKNGPNFYNLNRCRECRLATGGGTRTLWKPIEGWNPNHPVLFREKYEARYKKLADSREKRLLKNRTITKRLKKAAKAERDTEKIIQSSRNSGRVLRDGDHRTDCSIILDTKNQTQRAHPHVDLAELDKVRSDARNNGAFLGGLVLRNRFNRGVVVFDEEDYNKLLVLIKRENVEPTRPPGIS